jgi:hypothetical protein
MYRISDTVRCTHSQDGAIVLDLQQGQMFSVNPVGSRILELLSAGCTEPAIADEIGRVFPVSRETAEQDVQEFVQTLKERRIVEGA